MDVWALSTIGDSSMPLAILFWVLMIVSLFFGLWSGYAPGQPYPIRAGTQSFLMWILLAILGWAQFGGPVK
jgi:uncharacterized membrane protein YedE/YeeE